MSLFENIKYYYRQAKQKVESKMNALWTSYYVQAFYQGISAPLYSYHNIKTMYYSSSDLQNEMQACAKLNKKYARNAFLAYLAYYRIIHYLMSDETNDSYFQYFLNQVDATLYGLMILYFLMYEWPYNFGQNVLHTMNVTDFGGFAAPESHISSCECKEKLTNGRSMVFYALNRYGTTTVSYYIQQKYSNNFGWAVSFILESLSFGFPLLEYKLAAVKTCSTHRFETLIRDNKLYFFWFGASFVSMVWMIDYLSRLITNAENNFFFYDATFNFLFNWYALAALARVEKFPGGGKPRFDLLGVIKYLFETPPPQYVLELLKKKYSLDAWAKSEAVGALVLAHDEEITQWLSSAKNVLTKIEDVHSALWFSYVEWFAKPVIKIPDEIKSYCKKGYLTSKLEYLEVLITLAKEIQLERIIKNKVRSLENKAEIEPNKKVIARDTDSDDEWEDLLESKKAMAVQKNVSLNDQYFIYRNPSSNNIQDGWTEVEQDKPMTRNDSGLFRRHRPLKDAARKIIDEMKDRKNISAVAQMVTSVNPSLDHEFKRALKRL